MKVIEITDKTTHDSFVQSHKYGFLHQTWAWGEFQQAALGRSFFVLHAGNEATLASALIVRMPLPRGMCYLYAPRGPVFDPDNRDAVRAADAIMAEVARRARASKAVYFRIDPPFHDSQFVREFLKRHQLRYAHAQHQPELTLKIDLTKSEDDILLQMKQKGRYNIRLAEKHGVNVTESADVQAFCSLLRQTTTRDKFSGHESSYYEAMLRMPFAKLFLASFTGIPAAGAIVTYFGNTATYYYGASSNEHRSVMAPYLLHWRIIQDAKARGLHWYDFFGIAPDTQPHHPWRSVTEFKRKFGGVEERFIGAYECTYQPFMYWIMRTYKKILGR